MKRKPAQKEEDFKSKWKNDFEIDVKDDAGKT